MRGKAWTFNFKSQYYSNLLEEIHFYHIIIFPQWNWIPIWNCIYHKHSVTLPFIQFLYIKNSLCLYNRFFYAFIIFCVCVKRDTKYVIVKEWGTFRNTEFPIWRPESHMN